jgi:PXPV repeat-containing protein
MKSLSTRFLAAAALALGAFGAASAAHAGRSDVYFSVGVQSPGVYVQPAPVYVQPRHEYYVQPQPVYVQPRHVYVQPQPVYVTPRHYGYGNVYGDDWRWRHRERRHARWYGPYGDLDHDGVMNQYDRDRDGDGVRNRYDRFPDQPYRY